MNDTSSIYLVTPVIQVPSDIADKLNDACSIPEVAAVLLRLSVADERTQINRVKTLSSIVQKHGVAAVIAIEDDEDADIATIAARSGADGVHVNYAPNRIRALLDRLKGERSLGVGGLRNRDDAMRSGEMGADYVMFGEPHKDGFTPPRDSVAERAAWWAEIFETPCVAFAPDITAVGQMARTGAEFVALGDFAWTCPEGTGAAVNAVGGILRKIAAERAETP